MSDLKQLDSELREYLEKEPNLRREDRLVYLKTIFNKHFEMSKLEHVLNRKDFSDIISNAKSRYTQLKLPMNVSRKAVDSNELSHVAMIESFVSYLNNMSLLKKLVKFDYTD